MNIHNRLDCLWASHGAQVTRAVRPQPGHNTVSMQIIIGLADFQGTIGPQPQLADLARTSTLSVNQRLSLGGRYLENTSSTLWDCGINSECLLYLVSSDREPQSEDIQAHHVEHEMCCTGT